MQRQVYVQVASSLFHTSTQELLSQLIIWSQKSKFNSLLQIYIENLDTRRNTRVLC
jgi:hypothetical protein